MITFSQYFLIESSTNELKILADNIIDQVAEEGHYNHDTILQIARDRLKEDPSYQQPEKMKAALAFISNYIK